MTTIKVAGPGGFPVAAVKSKITAERHFTDDQGPLPGKPRKRLRNVLNRMEEVQGPFAALRKCRDTQTRVKVYTRSYNEVRGIMTGYVVAFDKHWNLLLRDVDEIFHKKIKCKTPVFDDVVNFTKVADLSLREKTDPEYKDPTTDQTPLIWQNPFSKKTNRRWKSQKPVLANEKCSSSEVSSRMDSTDNDWETRREARSTHGCRVDRAVLRGSSSLTREARALTLGRPTVWNEVREYSSEKRELRGDSGKGKLKKVPNETANNDLKEDSDNSGQSLESSVKPKSIIKHRKRKRSKIELRQRHVGQILVRGENVVLVNVLEV